MGELLIILVILVLVFGANKLPQLGEGIGKAIKNFKRGINHDDDIDVTPTDKRVGEGDANVVSDASLRARQDEPRASGKVQDAEVVERKG